MTATYRYRLQPYRGVHTRYNCPACGGQHRRTFARYEDTQTHEQLPAEFGRCNREAKCGYLRTPYQKNPDGTSYVNQARQQEPLVTTASRRRRPHLPAQPVVRTIPEELVQGSLASQRPNAFVQLLINHFGLTVAQQLVHRYELGSSAYWPGACVFWLRDHLGRMRGGQVVQFGADGHTVKTTRSDGSTMRCTTWVHTALQRTYTQRQEPIPGWLREYQEHAQKAPCLFGEAQLARLPHSQPIAIVEAPKTAVICAGFFPDLTWLAAVALSYLNPQRLAPLKGRRITLFPDASVDGRAFHRWQAVAQQLRAAGFDITVSDYLERHTTAEQQVAGLDLGDVLLEQWPGYPPSWDSKTLFDGSSS